MQVLGVALANALPNHESLPHLLRSIMSADLLFIDSTLVTMLALALASIAIPYGPLASAKPSKTWLAEATWLWAAQVPPGPLDAHPIYTPASAFFSVSKLSMRTPFAPSSQM